MRIKGDITSFASAQELERELDGGQEFDTLILDIEMEEKEMSVDDSFPLDGLHVEGVNADKVAYYGFDENDGHWVLTDAEGKVLTSSETAEITEDKLTGRKTLTAKEAGTGLLKVDAQRRCEVHLQKRCNCH